MSIIPSKSYVQLANDLFRDEKYQDAIRLYRQAISEHPELEKHLTMFIDLAESRAASQAKVLHIAKPEAVGIEDSTQNHELTVNERLPETVPSITFDEAINENLSELDTILSAKLNGPPKRLIKEYNSDLEASFIAELKKQNKKFYRDVKQQKASIIMPTYNRALTLEAAILSIVAQTHVNWELIIIDDGSTDDTKIILAKFKKNKKIRVINGEHNGVSAARNKGMEIATGDYVYYLDSDNTWSAHYLELMMFSFLHTGSLTGYAALQLKDEHDTIIGYRGEPYDWSHCLESNYIDINIFSHHISLLKIEGYFDISLKRMVDWDLILRYTAKHAPFYAPFVGCYYLESRNDSSRITLSEPLAFQKVVRLKNSLSDPDKATLSKGLKLNFAIKIPAPVAEKQQWGDYHYADSLREALEELGHQVTLDFHGNWYARPANSDDVVIVIRGLTAYKPRKGAINIIWNISHPDQVPAEEFEQYDLAYVASKSYAAFLKQFVKTKVRPLLQCSDPSRFHYERSSQERSAKLLFVGNSRNEYRPIVKKTIESGEDLAIYGSKWSGLVPPKYILGENVANNELSRLYASHRIVLNDHWESMREYGYVSNRIFDVLASGGTLVSDPVPSISHLFGRSVIQLESNDSFESIKDQLQEIEDFGEHRRRTISEFVNAHHSFTNRARVICDDVLDRLGLPSTWCVDKASDSGMVSFNEVSRSKVVIGLLLENIQHGPNHAAYRRLISPLTTETAIGRCEIVLLRDIKEIESSGCSAIVVQQSAIQNLKDTKSFLDLVTKLNLQFYMDIYEPIEERIGAAAQDPGGMQQLMSRATHIWYATDRLALYACGKHNSSSTVSDSVDIRLWRNFRRAQPTPSLSKKYRILWLASDFSQASLEVIAPALDKLYNSEGAIFELVVIGKDIEVVAKPWLRIIKPSLNRSVFPHYARWLLNAEKFDIGVIPSCLGLTESLKSDYNFLHYTALGIPTICSKNASTYRLQEDGLVISCENSTDQWFRAFHFAFDNRNLMIAMASRAWSYVWQCRSSKASTLQMLSTIEDTTVYSAPIERTYQTPISEVAVCLHLYYVDQWEKYHGYLKNIPCCFDLYVTCTTDAYDNVRDIVGQFYPAAKIIAADNHGMDVLPFLVVNHDYGLWRYPAVLKLHTKNTKTADDQIFGKLCLESLLSSPEQVVNSIQTLASDPLVGAIGPDPLYRSAESLMYVNAEAVRDIFVAIDRHPTLNDWGFYAGTMFWIQGNLLSGLATHFGKLNHLALQDSRAVRSGGDGTWAHAMERIFGALPSLYGMCNAVSYLTSTTDSSWCLRTVDDGEFHKSLSFRTSSKWHLARYANIGRWAKLCIDSDFFDNDYYIANAGAIIPEEMPAIVHYLLYGDDLRLDPNFNFSTNYYRAKHPDVIQARVPMLVHYLVCGLGEGRAICTASDY